MPFMTNRRQALQWLGASAAGLALPLPAAFAQAFPSKPVRVLVGAAPGGPADFMGRTFSDAASPALGQPFVVDNKPGATGTIAAGMAAKAPADGHTLLIGAPGAIVVAPHLIAKLDYDADKDFTPITMLGAGAFVLVAHPSVPANNLAELVALSKKQKLNFAVTAIGSAPHMAGVAVEKATGAEWAYIPYKGGAQAIGDTVAGQTQVLMNGMLATLPQVQAGKLKVLGVSKATRMPLLGNVPTIAEQGIKGFESGTWQGLLVPAATPPAVLARLSAEVTRIIRSPAVRERLVSQGAEVHTMSPTDFTAFFERERKQWAGTVAQSGVKID